MNYTVWSISASCYGVLGLPSFSATTFIAHYEKAGFQNKQKVSVNKNQLLEKPNTQSVTSDPTFYLLT